MKFAIVAAAFVVSSFALSSITLSAELAHAGQLHTIGPTPDDPKHFGPSTFFADQALNGN